MVPSDEAAVRQAIEQLRAGEMQAFEYLFNTHKKRVFNLCLRMTGNHAAAEDLTQEAFLTVFRRINTFRGESRFGTWLHRIAVNCVLMHIRERSCRITEVTMDEFDNGEEEPFRDRFGSLDPALEFSLDRLALDNAIAELPPGYRIVIVLHDIEGYEHAEIAQLLGCSVGNTKSQLHKARMKLRRLLTAKHVPQRPATAWSECRAA
ncbi:MAG: RNA polymerase sigma factor [Terriglobales bacterium]